MLKSSKVAFHKSSMEIIEMKIRMIMVSITFFVGAICLSGGSTVFAAPAAKDTVDVIDFNTGVSIDSGVAVSDLVRTKHGVSMTIDTSGLEPGAYTNWFVIFNHPENCGGVPCGEGDLDPSNANGVGSSALFATGNVVDSSGLGGFGAHLSEGNTSGALFGPGLLDARAAEVHLVVRYHGPVIPALMPGQIHSVGGGCGPGLFACKDVQAAVHVP
jgi:hypothetical protein